MKFATKVDGKKVETQAIRKEIGDKVGFTYTWQQTFPAGKTLLIEHQYMTAPSTSFFYAESFSRYCLEKDAEARIKKMGAYQHVWYVGYILKTAATWKGPIGKFRLVVDKVRKDSIVSFCAEGVHKIGPTQFEILKKDFLPDKDIEIMFVKPSSSNSGDHW